MYRERTDSFEVADGTIRFSIDDNWVNSPRHDRATELNLSRYQPDAGKVRSGMRQGMY